MVHGQYDMGLAPVVMYNKAPRFSLDDESIDDTVFDDDLFENQRERWDPTGKIEQDWDPHINGSGRYDPPAEVAQWEIRMPPPPGANDYAPESPSQVIDFYI